ncbi:MAG: hypothetical protein ISS45_12115 [Candidatus Omnitrophica bacterium]|nr:hypothetical protein [Candidatus Omnitrophota bacterium]
MINSKKTLLAYLDILGYRDIIDNKTPEEFHKSIIDAFKHQKELLDGLFPSNIISDADRERQCNAEIVQAIKFSILSDSIIIYLHYDDIKRITKSFYELIDNDYSGIVLFFHIVSTFVLLFIGRVGFLLRGGICLGEFYSNTFNDCVLNGDLIFSKAFVKAYLLEQAAIHPRILVDKSLYELWRIKVEETSKHELLSKVQVVRDRDGEYFLDFYNILRTYPIDFKKYWLDSIIGKIDAALIDKKDIKNAWKKWYWFKEYHNRNITTFAREENQDLDDLLIK